VDAVFRVLLQTTSTPDNSTGTFCVIEVAAKCVVSHFSPQYAPLFVNPTLQVLSQYQLSASQQVEGWSPPVEKSAASHTPSQTP